jgi:hypothetical protein
MWETNKLEPAAILTVTFPILGLYKANTPANWLVFLEIDMCCVLYNTHVQGMLHSVSCCNCYGCCSQIL